MTDKMEEGATIALKDANERMRALESVLRVGVQAGREPDLEKAVQVIIDAATKLTGAAFGAFFYNVIDKKGESCTLYAISGVPRKAFSRFPMPRNTAVFGPTFRGESIVRSADITKDPRYGHNAPHRGQPEGHPAVRSYLGAPVISGSGELLGSLFFGHAKTGKFSARHEEIVAGIAVHAAGVIANARLRSAAQDKTGGEQETAGHSKPAENALTQLRDSERNFRLLVQSVTEYAIYMLDPTGKVVTWNAGAERIKGYKPEEIIGKHFSTFFPPEDRDACLPQYALQTATERGRFESEAWRVRKDGSKFWALVVIHAVHDENGKLLGFAKIIRDMTKRRDAQFQIERAREQMAQSQKMEAIGQLTGGIAHDFNNLLMIVSGQAQLLRQRFTDAKNLRALDAIEQAAKNGANLTRQLLTFSRRQRLNPAIVDLGARVGAFRDLLASSVGGTVELAIAIPPQTWPVEVDAGELELALMNIAVNARDAMPNGGSLNVVAENVSLPAAGGPMLEGDFVTLALSDTGTGIPPQILQKIFEPFFTTKEVGKGTGLGLSQVYGFARQSNGDVTIESDSGRGAKVTLYLPRATRAPVQAAAPKPLPKPGLGTGTVLIVEDNVDVAQVSAMLLAQLGYRVLVADRPQIALQMLATGPGVDLVFSDIVMPGEMDGLALAEAIREKYPRLPVLLATGYSSAVERAGHRFAILRKPYEMDALGAAVALALNSAEVPV